MILVILLFQGVLCYAVTSKSIEFVETVSLGKYLGNDHFLSRVGYEISSDNAAFPSAVLQLFDLNPNLSSFRISVTSGRWIFALWGNPDDLHSKFAIPPHGTLLEVRMDSNTTLVASKRDKLLRGHISRLLHMHSPSECVYKEHNREMICLNERSTVCVTQWGAFQRLHPCLDRKGAFSLFSRDDVFDSWFTSLQLFVSRHADQLHMKTIASVVSDGPFPSEQRFFSDCPLIHSKSVSILNASTTSPLLRHKRWKGGSSLKTGTIFITIENNSIQPLDMVLYESIPKWIRPRLQSISSTVPIRSIRHYEEHFEIRMHLLGNASVLLRYDFDMNYLWMGEYPPDIHQGIDHSLAWIEFDGNRLFLDSVSIDIPSPDKSMPFNVIAISSCIFAFSFASLLLLLLSPDEILVKKRQGRIAAFDRLRLFLSRECIG